MKKLLQLLALASVCLLGVNAWAVDPIAVWGNFKADTANNNAPTADSLTVTIGDTAYTLTASGCEVDSEGNLVLGSAGISLSNFAYDTCSLAFDVVSLPETITTGTLATFTLASSGTILNYSKDASEFYIGYTNNEDNQSFNATLTSGKLLFTYGKNNGTYGYNPSNGSVNIGSSSIKESSHGVVGFCIGAYAGGDADANESSLTTSLTGMKIRAIYLFNTCLTSMPTEQNFLHYEGRVQTYEEDVSVSTINATAETNKKGNGELHLYLPAGATLCFDAALSGAVKLYCEGDVTLAFSDVEGVELSTEKAKIDTSGVTGEVKTVYAWTNADAAGTAAVRDAQRSVFTFCIPAGNGVEVGDVVNISSITMGKAATDATNVAPRMGFDATFNNGESNTGNSKVSVGTLSQAVDQTGTIQVNESTSTTALKYIFENGVTAVVGKSYLIGLYAANNETWWASSGTGVAPYLEVASSAPIISSGDTTYAPVYVIEGTVTATPPLEITEDTELAAPSRVASIAAGKTVTVTSGNVTFVQNATIGDGATLIAPAGSTIDLSQATFGANVVLKVDVSNCWGETDSPYVLPEGAQVTFVQEGNLLSDEVLTFDTATGKVKETEPLGYELTWMPIGDSITEGEQYMGHDGSDLGVSPAAGNANTRGGYRYQLWKQLEEGGQSTRTVGFRTAHRSTNETPKDDNPDGVKWAWHCGLYSGTIQPITTKGAQMYNVETALENAGYPDVISVLIGINDLEATIAGFDSQNTTDSNTAHATAVYDEWVKLIEKIAANRPHSKIVVSTLLPVRRSDHQRTDNRRQIFNAKMRTDAAAKTIAPFDNPNVIFVDVAQLAFPDDTHSSTYIQDWAHPNEEGSKLVAKAFRLGLLKAIKDIQDEEKTPLAITQVHNGESGKVVVRLNKPLPDGVSPAGLSLDSTRVEGVVSIDTEDPRKIVFAPKLEGDTLTVPYGATTATLTLADDSSLITDEKSHVEIYGSGAAKNVPASFLPNTYRKYATITIHDNANNTGTSANDAIALEEDAPALISRVGYYMELKRANMPAQFVWVSMDAALFDHKSANVGLPGYANNNVYQGYVDDLEVFGNRGNFDHEVTADEEVQGWIEFSPYGWSGNADAQLNAPTEAYGTALGWNDNLENTSNYGCMQVARVLCSNDVAAWNNPAAEMLFAYNQFRTSDASSLGIGSFSVNRADPTTGNDIAVVYDWTYISGHTNYSAYQLDKYDVKKIEIWVEEMPKETWIGGAADEWSNNSKWLDGTAPESTEIAVELQAGSILTLTGGNYSTVFSGDGTLAIAEDAKVTLTSANSYEGGTHIAAGAVLTASHANALGTTGAITGSGTLVYPEGYPAHVNGLTAAGTDATDGWRGTVVITNATFEGQNIGGSNQNKSLEELGNENSTIRLKGTNSGYFGWKTKSDPVVCAAAIELEGSLTLTRGHTGGYKHQFTGEWTGAGTFTLNESGSRGNYTVQFTNLAGFNGSLVLGTEKHKMLVGETGTAEQGQLLISDTATLAQGATWSAVNGVVVDAAGVLEGAGTIGSDLSFTNGATLKVGATPLTVSGESTVTVADTLTVQFANDTTATKGKILKKATTDGTHNITLSGDCSATKQVGEGAASPGYKAFTDTAGDISLRRKGFMLMIK